MELRPVVALPSPWESKEIMRNLSPFLIALVLVASGCTGVYDRELLGDPEPPRAAPVETVAEPAPVSDEYAEYDSVAVVGDPWTDTPADYAMFDDLDMHGTWYETDRFGFVWQPLVVTGWQPFHSGHWIWTSYGWMWVSYEPFGWATYHYGSWWLDPVLGWIWIPGYDWLPCPVDWFYDDWYIGWAPLPPPDCHWDDPWEDHGKYKDGWTVVEAGKFKEVEVGENNVPPERFKSRYRTGGTIRRAPDTRTVEKATRQTVKETSIRIDSKRVGGREVRRVELPSYEREIISRFPMPRADTGPTPLVSPVADTGGGGGSGGSAVTPPSGSKSKGSSQPEKRDSEPAKFKSRGESKGSSSDGKAKADSKNDGKDSGKSKGDSKGGDSKDDGKDSGKGKGKKR
jgi:hypothetical protein